MVALIEQETTNVTSQVAAISIRVPQDIGSRIRPLLVEDVMDKLNLSARADADQLRTVIADGMNTLYQSYLWRRDFLGLIGDHFGNFATRLLMGNQRMFREMEDGAHQQVYDVAEGMRQRVLEIVGEGHEDLARAIQGNVIRRTIDLYIGADLDMNDKEPSVSRPCNNVSEDSPAMQTVRASWEGRVQVPPKHRSEVVS